jgi:hypothetical protein
LKKACLIIAIFLLSTIPVIGTAADHVVISEIQLDSVIGYGGTENDFVELHNPTSEAVDLIGYSVQKTNATGGNFYRKRLTGTIPAYGFFLIVRNYNDTSQELKDAADVLGGGEGLRLSENNTVYLVSNDSDIENSGDEDIIDFVGFGAAENFENMVAENPPEATSLERKSGMTHVADRGNGWDTDDNSADFFIQNTPNPQNSASTVENPSSVEPSLESELDPTNLAPNVPTELMPTDLTNSKIFSARYSDPEQDMGTVEFRIFSDEPIDCPDDESLVFTISSELVGNGATAEVAAVALDDGEYFWCARAHDGNTHSDFAETQNFTLDTTAPVFPDGSELVASIGNGAVSLNWPAAERDVAAYRLQINERDWQELGDVVSFTATGLNNDQEYEFKILAYDDVGNESIVLTQSATPIAPQTASDVEASEIVINEVAWMGTIFSDHNEWIELWNTSTSKIFELTDWKIISEDGGLEITLSGELYPDEYFLLERTDDESVPDVAADQIYSGSLSNSGEILILQNSTGTEIDRVDGSQDWDIGGDNADKKTLARLADGGFGTSSEISGTPRMENFPKTSNQTISDDSDDPKIISALTISEFVPNPEGNDTEHEWIELFNSSDVPIDLASFELNGVSLSGEIAANEYKVFAVSDFSVGWKALPNTTGTVVLRNSDGMTLDEMTYISATEQKSWGRVDDVWTEFWHPTPGVLNIELNSAPEARITIQGNGNTSGDCSLFVNLTAEDSVDPDRDTLTYEWEFGDEGSADVPNPSGFHFGPGEYEVRLVATDVLGESSEAIQNFSVSGCSSSSGGETLQKVTAKITEPTIVSVPAKNVELLITEVAFNSAQDWVKVLVVDDGNRGKGIDLKGFYFEDDKKFKTIPEKTFLKTGESLLLTFGSEEKDWEKTEGGVLQIFTTRKGLTKTDEQIILKDSTGEVEDAVVWENRDGKWSRGEDTDVQDLVAVRAWASVDFEKAVDSSVVKRDVVIKRIELVDSNSETDWKVVEPSPAAVKQIPTTPEAEIRISEILANPIGSDREEWLELINVGKATAELFGWSIQLDDKSYEFEESNILASNELRIFQKLMSLKNSGGVLQLINPNGEVIDSIEYPAAKAGIAYARNLKEEFSNTEIPTPNAENNFFQILSLDEDGDADGLSDTEESKWQTDPAKFDSDGDYLPDAFEISYGLNPLEIDSSEEKLTAYRKELAMIASSRLEYLADEEQGVSLSGIGIPGGVLRIYLQSDLNIVEVPVDETGTWSYFLDRELPAGKHHIFTQLIAPNGVEGVAEKVMEFIFEQDFTPPQYPMDLRISELLPNPEGEDLNEWIELENFSDEPADISGFTLSTEKKSFIFPEDSHLPPKSFLLLPRSLDFTDLELSSSYVTGLTLRNSKESVSLLSPAKKLVSELSYKKAKEGIALAWDGENFVQTETLTPGEVNAITIPLTKSSSKSNVYANGNLSTEVFISEVLANPKGKDSAEWIEIWNSGVAMVNLGNWQLDDAAGGSKLFIFPDTTILQPNEFRIFSRTLTKLQLNNSEEEVRLFDWRGAAVSQVQVNNAREGMALARDIDGEFRETKIPTPNAENQFETLSLFGRIEFQGDAEFLVQTTDGAKLVSFGASSNALLARAIFTEGEEYKVFVSEGEDGRLILQNFNVVPELLKNHLLDLNAGVQVGAATPEPATLVWVFVILMFGGIGFLFWRFVDMDQFWESEE